MMAGTWSEGGTQLYPVTAHDLDAQHDDDEALDDWLASMSVPQFERILNLLLEGLGGARASQDRLA